jgi:hypothetical protein
MAIIIDGITECLICGKPLFAEEDIQAFPAFLKRKHPLNRYSDSAMHRQCYDACPDKEELDRLLKRFEEIWESRPRDLKTKEEIDEWGKAAFKDFG